MTMHELSRTSPKKSRRPQRHTRDLWDAIAEVAGRYERMSVRQLFYQLVSFGIVAKTESAYKRIADASVQMRLSGDLPYSKITDGHRSRRLSPVYGGVSEALADAHAYYRRDYWRDQPRHVEVWSEKDALSGIIHPVCDRYAVPYVACRGFPSLTLVYESAGAILAADKPAVIFYFGDHDASGRAISDKLEADLRHHGADVTVERIALNPDQITTYTLPTRPGKHTDSRHASFVRDFGDASVELDALPPNILADLVESAILSEVDRDAWAAVQQVEILERHTLASLSHIGWRPGVSYDLTGGNDGQ